MGAAVSLRATRLRSGVEQFGFLRRYKTGYTQCQGLLIRRPREKDLGDEAVPDREALAGLFGMVPHWATDLKICRSA